MLIYWNVYIYAYISVTLRICALWRTVWTWWNRRTNSSFCSSSAPPTVHCRFVEFSGTNSIIQISRTQIIWISPTQSRTQIIWISPTQSTNYHELYQANGGIAARTLGVSAPPPRPIGGMWLVELEILKRSETPRVRVDLLEILKRSRYVTNSILQTPQTLSSKQWNPPILEFSLEQIFKFRSNLGFCSCSAPTKVRFDLVAFRG